MTETAASSEEAAFPDLDLSTLLDGVALLGRFDAQLAEMESKLVETRPRRCSQSCARPRRTEL